MNVLFTSVGRRTELLRAFRRAYAALAMDGSVIAVDIDPLAPALRQADRCYIVPSLSDPNYIDILIQICQLESVGMIFPLIDPDISVLAAHRQILEATGAHLAVVSSQAASICGDKWRVVEFFQGLGLQSPHSWLPGQYEPTVAEYPLFVKPRNGSAAKNTFKVNDSAELAFFSKYVPAAIVQDYLDGAEITSDVICDLNGQLLAVVSRQRLEVRWGEVAKGVTVNDPQITAACVKVAQALPAVGPITVQCILKDGVPYFTEINARLGGGAPLAIAAGVDFPRWLLARAAGLPMEIPPLGTYQTGLYLTRFDDSIFLTQSDYDHLANQSLASHPV